MLILLAQHPIFSRSDGKGGMLYYYYYDVITWVVGALALAWLIWYLVSSYRRARALRRPRRRTNYKLLKQVVKVKRELSSRYLRPGFSRRIHAVGIGMLDSDSRYCIQIFINDANEELWTGSGAAALPNSYRGVPVVPIEMPMASFLADAGSGLTTQYQYPEGIRERQEVIIGGISGANTNLTGQSGTIGYFCTRKTRLPRRKEIYLLSNSHVFADLRKAKVDNGDLIMQPSPGEPSSNRPIGTLVHYSTLKFDRNISEPNHVDAAFAKLWAPLQHQPLIPLIGAVKGYVATNDVAIGEAVRKFGRTTGYTEGLVCSICLDIWIRYDRTGQSAFFQDQFLVEPARPRFNKFVSGGDSGSLLIDADQHAIGLVFAGMSELPESLRSSPEIKVIAKTDPDIEKLKKIEGYGIANPINEVLDRLKIDLLV
jgi:hypothetical protein